MFRDLDLVRPKTSSLLLACAVAIAVFVGSQLSAYVGYVLALMTMVMIAIAYDSCWPTLGKPENPLIFSLFWGLILGLLLPYLVEKIMDGEFESIIQLSVI